MGMTADEENKDADVKLLDAKAGDVKLDAAERGGDADAKDEKAERGGDADAKDAKAADAKDAAPPAPPPFRFFQEFLPLLRDIHAMVVALPGYGPFLAKYGALQVVRLATALSPLVAARLLRRADFDDLSPAQYAALGCVGAINVLGRLAPFASAEAVDALKESLQITQATAVVAKLFELPHDAMLSTPTGEFVQLIAKVFRNLDTLLPALYGAILPVAVETLCAVGFVAYVYGWIAAVLLGLFLAYSKVAYAAAGSSRRKKAERNKNMMMAMLSEWGKILATAQSYERAHVFGNVGHEVATVRGAFARIGDRITALSRLEHREGLSLTFLTLTTTLGFLALVSAADVRGTAVERVALMFYLFIYIGGFDPYAVGFSNLRAAVFEYQTFHAFVAKLSDVADAPGAAPIARRPRPSIEFRNVSFSYGGRAILDDVSFACERGQTVGLVGASGCGKSTVLRLLLRFYRPSSGSIFVDGKDVHRDITGDSLRALFSVVTQDAQIFNGSIRDNIAYGKLGATDDEILAAARAAELVLDAGDLTLDKDCGEKGAKLSGGQQQRVSLARAILKSGSDLRAADQILYLDGGRVVERGSYDSLMEQRGAFFDQVNARR
ncbi:heme-transporting ATPase [Aureococcus anophagefferens]|nr:heme-transporting ATPase [Aureococcus anophagefferens]